MLKTDYNIIGYYCNPRSWTQNPIKAMAHTITFEIEDSL